MTIVNKLKTVADWANPPSICTNTPTIKTAEAVNKRPTLKQNPTADIRIRVGNNSGM